MIRLGVLFGGRSCEHEVSLMSATSVINALNPEKYSIIPIGITKRGDWKLYEGPVGRIEGGAWESEARPMNPGDLKKEVDFAFPVLHGAYGEDGTIQGFFEMLDLPYAGCGVLASALAMDKAMAKEVFSRAGIPGCRYALAFSEEFSNIGGMEKAVVRIERTCGDYPLFVKPANSGSSVGISKANNRERLIEALRIAARYDRRLIIEQGVAGRELETAVVGNVEPEAAAVGEIIPSAEFYDYTAKYLDGGQSKLCIPADVPEAITQEIRQIAIGAYKALDCTGFARVDFFLEKGTNKIYLNEINTIPGFTKYSMFPLLWKGAGVTYSRLLERIVELGYERYHAKDHR